MQLAIWLLAVIALFSLVGTLIPQNQQAAEYISRYGHTGYEILLKTGLLNMYSSWWFIFLMGLLSLNLSVCLINRFSPRLRLLGTFLSHFSILMILAGALTGMFFGEKGYVQIKEGQSIDSFISKGKPVALNFSLKLEDFIYEEYIDDEENLLVYDNEGALLLELNAGDDKNTAIADSGYSIKILRYVPDFSMDLSTKEVVSRSQEPINPALQVALTDKDGNSVESWVFARYPDVHMSAEKKFNFKYQWKMRRPKEFISRVAVIKDREIVSEKDIKVNSPLKYGGYAFFQSSYDKESLAWSGLQIVKDPGVPIVYLGFILLIFGLSIIFYVNPALRSRAT